MKNGVRFLFGVLWTAAAAMPAVADEACDAEFRTLMQQGNDGFPYAAIIRTEFSGSVSELPVVVAQANHSMTLNDEFGQRYITKGNKTWLSTDKGESWELVMTLPDDTVTKTKEKLEKQAVGATEISCTDGVELSGAVYRLVQGSFTTDTTNLTALQKFYVLGPGETWQVTVTELTIGGQPSVITTTKTTDGIEPAIPEVDG